MKKDNSLENIDNGNDILAGLSHNDDQELVALGYQPSFKREFSSLATVCFFFLESRFFKQPFIDWCRLVLHSVSWRVPSIVSSNGLIKYHRGFVRVLRRRLTPLCYWEDRHLCVGEIEFDWYQKRSWTLSRLCGVGFSVPVCALHWEQVSQK